MAINLAFEAGTFFLNAGFLSSLWSPADSLLNDPSLRIPTDKVCCALSLCSKPNLLVLVMSGFLLLVVG